jgi:hypothetical protein
VLLVYNFKVIYSKIFFFFLLFSHIMNFYGRFRFIISFFSSSSRCVLVAFSVPFGSKTKKKQKKPPRERSCAGEENYLIASTRTLVGIFFVCVWHSKLQRKRSFEAIFGMFLSRSETILNWILQTRLRPN